MTILPVLGPTPRIQCLLIKPVSAVCNLDCEYCFYLDRLDGPEEIHDTYRFNKRRQGTWRQVMRGIETLRKGNVEFNILCVVSQANVHQPRQLYQWFRNQGFAFLQYIPLAEFDQHGNRLPFALTPEQYGRFLVETFECWWPERRQVRARFFDNIVEALVGQKPGNCTLHQTCDSYVVVEYNGDVYPCDFFVESGWKLGNITVDSFAEIARRSRRREFAATKVVPHEECLKCEFEFVCHGGCPKLRHGRYRRFEDLDLQVGPGGANRCRRPRSRRCWLAPSRLPARTSSGTRRW